MKMTFKLYASFIKQAYLEFIIAYIVSVIIVAYANFAMHKSGGAGVSAIILLVAISIVFVALHVKYILKWFHRDFFTRSGYITFMIPASFNTLILSRLLALLTFYIISMIIIYLEYSYSYKSYFANSESVLSFVKSAVTYFFEVATFCFLMVAFRDKRFKMMYCIGAFALIYIFISIGQFSFIYWRVDELNGDVTSFSSFWYQGAKYIFNTYVAAIVFYIVAFFRLKSYEL
ncbi:hypothetical protein [Helicobacter sp. 11S02629-2]|uniref:hypothetical protein n=1 Tax=Helicobacter sp. 11S02629-2 TaxID=1476195 RepID=UPI000BA4EE67|nr:hypothetical protein [Helicobacter sp. 11S02629-2]PAF45645.1 hypothetical protein BKH40_01825 [Helicobacter sp. 11S02629-2]